ncbi:unnamed protein product [Orchesella dallaii]|uniref:Ionotropic receptor n=1 Tax=Orchesella dallaii TaxID=48710 RepID=A0ABP1QIX0_9HEXA
MLIFFIGFDFISNHNETAEIKQVARFRSHAYLIRFVSISSKQQMDVFLAIYERLIITSIQRKFFDQHADFYKAVYNYYDSRAFKLEFLRSRWNIDEISTYQSVAADEQLQYETYHLPKSMERRKNRHKNLTDIVTDKGLWYKIVSGGGQNCKHDNISSKLRGLTQDFNAYDRLFCDAFEYYSLTFTQYFNPGDLYYLRGILIRDDTMSTFPPDSSQVVYYANPQVSFVVLTRHPETWMFIFRPFPQTLWMSLFFTLAFLFGIRSIISAHFELKVNHSYLETKASNFLKEIRIRFQNMLGFFNMVLRIVIMSSYGGMVLFGILYPIHQWTPDTFEELNKTKNYVVGTSQWSPISKQHLVDNFVLNGVQEKMWMNRNVTTPAVYLNLEFNGTVIEHFLFEKPMTHIVTDTYENEHFFAALAHDDRLNLWMKGRKYLNITYKFLKRIKPAKGKVLLDTRYVSVAPGATRLHFLLDAIKWGFTCGTWMRYQYLEMNYYKIIAPIIVHNMMRAQNLSDVVEESGTQPLNIHHVYSVFVLNLCGLVVASFVWYVESRF